MSDDLSGGRLLPGWQWLWDQQSSTGVCHRWRSNRSLGSHNPLGRGPLPGLWRRERQSDLTGKASLVCFSSKQRPSGRIGQDVIICATVAGKVRDMTDQVLINTAGVIFSYSLLKHFWVENNNVYKRQWFAERQHKWHDKQRCQYALLYVTATK